MLYFFFLLSLYSEIEKCIKSNTLQAVPFVMSHLAPCTECDDETVTTVSEN